MKEDVLKFLKKHVYCTLATSSRGEPLATEVLYVPLDFDLVFFTGESTKKLKNLRKNPRSAVSVAGRRLLFFPQAVEMQGRSEILSGEEAEKAKKTYHTRHKPEILAARKVAKGNKIRWVRFHPDKIFAYGIGTRLWDLDPAKQFKKVM
jgi:nitroimidazol reductase NimA-like FMN-containing flavoprotein (pyridoxamine 5'-phosphate oxidase superfamily)